MGTATNLIEVTLEKVHTHAGREHPIGSKIFVTESEGKFLLNNKVIKSLAQPVRNKAEKGE